MKISFQIEAADLVQVKRLGLRPRKWLAWVGLACLGVLIVAVGLMIRLWISTGVFVRELGWFLGVTLYLAFLYYGLIPWHAKRIFRQQKTLHHPVTVEFGDDAFFAASHHGQVRIAWHDFHKWKANAHVILLYHSDNLCNVIPCRAFSTPDELGRAVALLEQKIGPPKV